MKNSILLAIYQFTNVQIKLLDVNIVITISHVKFVYNLTIILQVFVNA
jgi:hypothetical protein